MVSVRCSSSSKSKLEFSRTITISIHDDGSNQSHNSLIFDCGKFERFPEPFRRRSSSASWSNTPCCEINRV